MNIGRQIYQSDTGTEKELLSRSSQDKFEIKCGLDILELQDTHTNQSPFYQDSWMYRRD